MQIADKLHAFLWRSSTIHNCNTYSVDGATRVLIDPGHLNLFEHVEGGLKGLGVEIRDIGLVITTHAHSDHIEAVQLFKRTETCTTIHEKEWEFVREMKDFIGSVYGIDTDAFTPNFFLQEEDFLINGLELKVLHTPGPFIGFPLSLLFTVLLAQGKSLGFFHHQRQSASIF